MISLHNRLKSTFCLAVGLLFLSLISSCKPTQTEAKPDARDELVSSLKGANVEGYDFATEEDESQTAASLTNNAVRKLIKLDRGDTNMVLRYTGVKDKKTNTTRTYKTEIVKAGSDVTLLATDIATGEVVFRQKFQPPEPHKATDPTFNNADECRADFDCKHGGALLCEANRTCKDQFAWLTCFFKDGTGLSMHLIIKPTRRICGLIGVIPNMEGVVLAQ